MTKLESLKKKEHFRLVLNGKVVVNDFFSIHFIKNFEKSKKKLYLSFIIKKKNWQCSKKEQNQKKIERNSPKIIKNKWCN